MTMSTAARFDFGRVVERIFGIIGANAPVFLGLAIILAGVPAALVEFLTPASAFAGDWDSYVASLPAVGLNVLISVISAYVLQAALIHGAMIDMNGGRPDFVACLRTGFRFVLPLIGIGILTTIGVFLGFLLLVVPGVILAVLWSVATPAVVMENASVFGAFKRSAQLTKGHRWQVFGLLLVFMVIGGVASMIVAAVVGMIAAPFGGLEVTVAGARAAPGTVAVQAFGQAIGALIGGVGVASLYFELRRLKEGVGAKDLAAVFD